MKNINRRITEIIVLIVTLNLIYASEIKAQPIAVLITNGSSCNSSDGMAEINVVASQFDFDFEFGVDYKFPFTTNHIFTNLTIGSHQACVRDKNTGCIFSEEFTIEADNALTVKIDGTGNVPFCSTQSATLTASATGGSGLYEFTWNNGSTKQTITVNSNQKVSVTVKDIQTLCTKSASGDVAFTQGACSKDPNDIIGPEGYGPGKMITKSKEYPYMIRFENDPDFATAPAQIVKINQPLDTNVNIYSLRLGDFGFGGFNFQIPPNRTFYSTRLNVMDSLGVVVDITAGIDIVKREVFWIFESKDPNTGLPPANVNLGFLPINDSITFKGEGFVSYTIKAANHTQTGDSIFAKANIIFDVNAPIETPEIYNIIDAVAPVSEMNAQTVPDTSSISLTWHGHDEINGSGVRDYDLYLSINGGNYTIYQAGITDTSTTFTGSSGNFYSFFTIAEDNVGNREQLKSLPEISVDFRDSTPILVKAYIEGYYLGNGTMIAAIDSTIYPTTSDTIILQLASSNPPYNILFADTSLLQTNGNVTFDFDPEAAGNSYYLILHHRNALETWSSIPLQIQSDNNSYDFSNAITKAYGNNLKDLNDGNFALWSGDISDALLGVGYQDGIIESRDYSDMENAVSTILIGYVFEDITGDRVVESDDYSIIENNVYRIINLMRP